MRDHPARTTSTASASQPTHACRRPAIGVMTLQTVAPTKTATARALWIVPTDGSEPRRLTIGPNQDHHPRFSPDGRTLAFLSDRRAAVEEEPDRPKDMGEREDLAIRNEPRRRTT